MNNNRIIAVLSVLGIILILFFGADILRNRRQAKRGEFDFGGIQRPILYNESPRRGKEGAKLVVYEFADFSCSSCLSVQPVMERIFSRYKDSVMFAWKDFPFISSQSTLSAIAARCAFEQSKFWEYHDWLFENQHLDPSLVESAARRVGLDLERFTACLGDDNIQTLVERDFNEGIALGIDSTPTIVIGDAALVGIASFEDIERAILTALSK